MEAEGTVTAKASWSPGNVRGMMNVGEGWGQDRERDTRLAGQAGREPRALNTKLGRRKCSQMTARLAFVLPPRLPSLQPPKPDRIPGRHVPG